MANDNILLFARKEVKFVLNSREYERIKAAIAPYVLKDEFGEYTICNVYFDNDDDTLIRTSLDKPRFKQKLRLRSYGIPSDSDKVFLEIKKKYAGVVYKRRIKIAYSQAKEYVYGGKIPALPYKDGDRLSCEHCSFASVCRRSGDSPFRLMESFKPEEFYKLVKESGAIIVQAHPFRPYIHRANPKYIDGCEIFNGKDKDKDLNQKAQAWAKKEKFQIVTGGADYHRESQRGNVSGIITEEKINTNDDLVRILRNGRYEINMG